MLDTLTILSNTLREKCSAHRLIGFGKWGLKT